MALRRAIAERLQREMQRKGFTPERLAQAAHISRSVVEGYLGGSRELQFSELRPLCDVLTLRLMRLLSANFANAQLQYRQTGGRDRERAAAIENAFLAVTDWLPAPRRLPTVPLDDDQDDIAWLLAAVQRVVDPLLRQYPTVEALYRAAALPVLPVHAGDESFDAFLMRAEAKAVVCVNLDKSTVRIHFSLLHEMAHYLFHAATDLPIDVLPSSLYDDRVNAEVRPEYIANKFAQFFLVPFDEAKKMALHWPRFDVPGDYLTQRRTSPQVVANAIYDLLRIKPGPTPQYAEVKARVEAAVNRYGGDSDLRVFLEQERQTLRARLVTHRDEFADEVWASVGKAWDIPDA